MRKTLWPLFLTGSIAFGVVALAACGDDDTNPATPGADAGRDGATTDTGPNPTVDSGTDGTVDGGCTFAGFVIDLVQNKTTDNGLPSTDLGDSCSASESQDDFKPLFP